MMHKFDVGIIPFKITQISFSSLKRMSPSSSLSLIFLLLGALCSLIHLLSLWQRHHNNARKLPPGPLALPIIGNLHRLGKLPHRDLHHLAKKYGPIMSIRLGHVPTIVASSPQAAELFLKTHDTIFASRPKLQALDYMSYGSKGMAFSPYGPYWRNVKKLCALKLFSASKIESFSAMRKEELGFLVELLKEAAAAREVVDLSAKVGEVIENMTLRMICGRSSDDRFDLKPLINEAMNLAGVFNIADYVPYLAPLDLQGLTRRLKKVSKAMDKILEMIIDDHEQDASRKQGHHKDFVDILLSMMNEPMNPNDEYEYKIDRNIIKAIMLDMIVAAIDTSTTVIEWTLSELFRHPRVMTRVQKELEDVIGIDQMVEEKDLAKLDYFYMVVKESLRLHPAVPLLIPRESMEDIEINDYYIPKKSRIIINFWSIGRDPNVWSKNAEEFYPERFIGSNIDLRGRDFQLIPFGSGRRSCPGIQLGLTTVRIILAQLVHCFNWELPHDILPTELDMSEKFGLSMPRAEHLLTMPIYRLLVKD